LSAAKSTSGALWRRHPISIFTLNRPEKRHVMSPDMPLAMRNHMQRLQAERETRVLIIRGQSIE
jgi:enoyl-CoA hydratase/carnithine racemase